MLIFPPCLWTLGPERSVAPWALRNLCFLCWQKAGGGPSPWSWTDLLPTEEKGRKHTQWDNHWGFLHPSRTVWPETSLLCCLFSHSDNMFVITHGNSVFCDCGEQRRNYIQMWKITCLELSSHSCTHESRQLSAGQAWVSVRLTKCLKISWRLHQVFDICNMKCLRIQMNARMDERVLASEIIKLWQAASWYI